MKKVRVGIPLAIVIVMISGYATWYTWHRHVVVAQAAECDYQLAHPETAPKMRAPDGSMVPVMTPCLIGVTPPSLLELIRGRIVFADVPERMQVNPYTFWDVLLGRYSVSLNSGVLCGQSATTTNCSALSLTPKFESQPYVPPDPSQPIATWISATGTPISLYGFSFELPVGWHGSVYSSAYTGNLHALVQSESSDQGFTIDCPPSGKGLEAATRFSSEERLFAAGGIDYSVAFEKWTAPGNDPWYFLWVRMAHDSSGTYCLAQGSATPDIAQAMQTMYATWSAVN